MLVYILHKSLTADPPHGHDDLVLYEVNDGTHDHRGQGGTGDEVEVGSEQTERQQHHHT